MRYFQSCRRHPFRSDWASRMQALGAIETFFFFVGRTNIDFPIFPMRCLATRDSLYMPQIEKKMGERIGTSTRQEDRKCELGKSLESSLVPYNWRDLTYFFISKNRRQQESNHFWMGPMLPSLRLLLTILGVFVAGIHRVWKHTFTQELPLKFSNPAGFVQQPPQKRKGHRYQIPPWRFCDFLLHLNSQPVKSRFSGWWFWISSDHPCRRSKPSACFKQWTNCRDLWWFSISGA